MGITASKLVLRNKFDKPYSIVLSQELAGEKKIEINELSLVVSGTKSAPRPDLISSSLSERREYIAGSDFAVSVLEANKPIAFARFLRHNEPIQETLVLAVCRNCTMHFSRISTHKSIEYTVSWEH